MTTDDFSTFDPTNPRKTSSAHSAHSARPSRPTWRYEAPELRELIQEKGQFGQPAELLSRDVTNRNISRFCVSDRPSVVSPKRLLEAGIDLFFDRTSGRLVVGGPGGVGYVRVKGPKKRDGTWRGRAIYAREDLSPAQCRKAARELVRREAAAAKAARDTAADRVDKAIRNARRLLPSPSLDGFGSDRPDVLTLALLRERAGWLFQYGNQHAIPLYLAGNGYTRLRNPDADDGLWRLAGKPQEIYARATLPYEQRLTAARKLLAETRAVGGDAVQRRGRRRKSVKPAPEPAPAPALEERADSDPPFEQPEHEALRRSISALGRGGRPPPALTLEQLRTTIDFDWMLDRTNRRTAPLYLPRCGYVPVHKPGTKGGLWRIGGKRQAVYARAELNPERQLDAAAKLATTRSNRAGVVKHGSRA
jgi:hypothetical protein